jgi:hypothetical protein
MGCAPQQERTGSLPSEPDAGEAPVTCAVAPVEAWTGTARRDNDDGYPDHIAVEAEWRLASTDGCVDSYEPVGQATYAYAIPGAHCTQSIAPTSGAVEAGDGTLTIDRTTAPARFAGRAASHWTVTFRCEFDNGEHEQHDFEGGAPWFDTSGTIEGDGFAGTLSILEDDEKCGPEGIPPCTYEWAFTAR